MTTSKLVVEYRTEQSVWQTCSLSYALDVVATLADMKPDDFFAKALNGVVVVDGNLNETVFRANVIKTYSIVTV